MNDTKFPPMSFDRQARRDRETILDNIAHDRAESITHWVFTKFPIEFARLNEPIDRQNLFSVCKAEILKALQEAL